LISLSKVFLDGINSKFFLMESIIRRPGQVRTIFTDIQIVGKIHPIIKFNDSCDSYGIWLSFHARIVPVGIIS